MPRAPAADESRKRSQTGGPDSGAPFYESESTTTKNGGDGESMRSVNGTSNRNSSDDKHDSGNLGTPYLGSSPPNLGSSPPLTRQTLMKKKSSLMLDGGTSPTQSALRSSHQVSSRKSGRTTIALDDVLEDGTAAKTRGPFKGSVLDAVSKFKERSGKRISTLDQHTMSPFAKFRHYGRIPCKLVLNILIFSLLLFIIVAYELPSSTADESERKVLQLHFINAVIGDSDTEALMPGGDFYVDQPIIYLFERSEVLGAIERVMETYYSLAAISLNDFDVLFNDKGPYGWVPPNRNLSVSSTTSKTSQHIISPTSDAGQQVITPDVSGTVNAKDGSSEATVSKRVQRAKDFIGGSQLKYISSRKTLYTAEKPPPPPSLSTTLNHMFEGATTAATSHNSGVVGGDHDGSSSAAVISTLNEGHESYFEYVRSLYEDGNISDPNEIQNSWMLQPIMEIYMLSCSARVDWRVETNELITRSFYLARNAPLGPFRTDEAALEDAGDDDADDDEDALSSKRSSARTSLPAPPSSLRADPSDSNPFWLDFVCGPRPDPFFTGDHYLPCRLMLDADGDAENTTDDGVQGMRRKDFGTQAVPSKTLPRGRRGSRPAVSPPTPKTTSTKKSHRNNIKAKNEKKSGQKKRRTVFGAMPKPNRRMMRTTASTTTVAAPADPDYHALTPMGIFDQVQRITIQLQIQQVCSSINDKQETLIGLFYRDALYYWSISVVFETDLNGRVMVTFPVSFEERRGYEHLYITFFAILFLGGFSVWDFLLRVRAIQRIFRFRHMLRKKMKHHLKLLEEERIREEEEHNAAALAAFFDGGFYTGNVPEKSTTSIPRVGSKGSMFGGGSDGVNGSLGLKGTSSDEASAQWRGPEVSGDEEQALLQGRPGGRSSSPSAPNTVESIWKGVKRIARGEKFRKAQKSSGATPSVGHLQGAHLHNPHSYTDNGSLYSAVIRPEVRASNLSHGDLYSSANLQSQGGPPRASIAMRSNVGSTGQHASFNTSSPTLKSAAGGAPSPFGDDTAKFRKKWKKSLHADMGMSWHIWSILSNTLNVIYVCYTTALALQVGASIESSRTLRVVLGLSAMGSTALFVSYLRFFPNLYFMIRATSGSVTRLISFLIGVFPIYIGYAIFFSTVSSSVSTGMYLTVFRSFVALSFAWFGDNLLPDFEAASDSEFLHIHIVATFMLFSFIAVAMYCVLNLLLAIVSDSYMEIRRRYGLTIAPQDWYKRTAVAKKAAAEGADGAGGGGRRSRKNRRSSMGPITKRKGLLVTTAKQRMRNDALREVKRQLELLATTFDSSDDDDIRSQDEQQHQRPPKVKKNKNKNKKKKKVESKSGSLEASGNQEVGITEDGLAMTIPVINVNAPQGYSARSFDDNDNAVSNSRLQREYSDDNDDDGEENAGSGGEQSPLLGDVTNNNQSSGNFEEDEENDDETDEESEQRAELRDAYGGLLSEPGLDLRIFEEFERTKSRSRLHRAGSFNGGGSFTGTSQSRLRAATGSRPATSANFHASVSSSARAQSVANFLAASGRSHGSNAPSGSNAGPAPSTANLLLRPTRGALQRTQSADVTSRSAPTMGNEAGSTEVVRPMPSSASAANFGAYIPPIIRTVRSQSVLASDSDYTSSSYDSEDSDNEESD